MHYGDPPTTAIVKPTWLALLLGLSIVIGHFGFILMAALAKPLLGAVIVPAVSLALVLAAGPSWYFASWPASFFVIMENRKSG